MCRQVRKPPADHLNGASVDLQKSHLCGRMLKRGPVYGYAFQPRGSKASKGASKRALKALGWCILTNSQIIVYKDEAFSQRQSAERLSSEAKAYRFSSHEAPGEARRALRVELFLSFHGLLDAFS